MQITLHGPLLAAYTHRMPIADSSSTRSGDSVAALLPLVPDPRPEPELPLLLVLANDPFDVLPRHPNVPPRSKNCLAAS
ncbi:hypothetical protein [Streptomyces sp. NPDC087538]|uniref:hypothetical protein n=1 Tax=unclassified Streptomyces TaxID=2593676 RepID=UPI003821E9C0